MYEAFVFMCTPNISIYVGMMSGTSMDGVDAVACVFNEKGCQFIARSFEPYSDMLRESLLSLCQTGPDEVFRMQNGANEIAKIYAKAFNKLLTDSGLNYKNIRAIGAHGQTIRHNPQIGASTQLINGALLAELTKTDVITDFRSRDLAAGGEGAPLVPAFHKWVLSGDVPRGILNIGGISNLTVLPERGSDDEVLGFDCGPGNVLMDAWIEKVNHVRYDQDAVWARSGKVIPQLLESLKQEKFFSLVPPKSTGRELFNLPWLEARLNGEKPEDVQRTLVSFTAETVTDAIRNFAPHVKELRVCGGGAKNPLMISELALLNPELFVTTTADLGVDPQDVEGLAFAWLAYRFDRRESGNLPSATGASGSRILGCLYPA